MIVYPLPPQLPNNPYLDQLYAPMPALDIKVRRGRPRYEIPRLLVGHGPRLLHLHLFDELTQRRSLIATALRSLLFLALVFALRLRGVRLIWTAHNLQPHEQHHPWWGFLVYRTVARWSSQIIAHSAAARAQLQARYGDLPQCVIIPHGNYIGMYGTPRDRAASRAALHLPAIGPVVLCFGALRPYKGIEDLLIAFEQLPESWRGTLIIAGGAKDRAYGATLARAAAAIAGVRLELGYIPNQQLAYYLGAADLVVLPYHSVLTSGSLLGALSYARPVVAPAFGPVGELVHEGVQGFLYTPNNLAALRAALERALAHPNLDALGQAGLATAREFAWPKIAKLTAACYVRAHEYPNV